MVTPATLAELQEAVRAHPRVLAIGAGTKPRASAEDGFTPIALRALRGMVEYDASEYTFTAWAGTPIAEIEAALAAKGQYLPFDPPLVRAGATLGGTLAAAVSGPGRYRYGGVRDFLLAVTVVDGTGEAVRGGAKVVKNAAGFDLPKLLVGSLGRLGIVAQATFKVFPRPAAVVTLAIDCPTAEEAVAVITRISHSRWEADALDYSPAHRAVWLRLAHPAAALDPLVAEISRVWPDRVRTLSTEEAASGWSGLLEWSPDTLGASVARVPVTPLQIPRLEAALAHAPGLRVHYSVGGNLAWLGWSGPVPAPLNDTLSTQGLGGVLLRGEGPLRLGRAASRVIDSAIKRALDPQGRFPS